MHESIPLLISQQLVFSLMPSLAILASLCTPSNSNLCLSTQQASWLPALELGDSLQVVRSSCGKSHLVCCPSGKDHSPALLLVQCLRQVTLWEFLEQLLCVAVSTPVLCPETPHDLRLPEQGSLSLKVFEPTVFCLGFPPLPVVTPHRCPPRSQSNFFLFLSGVI